MADIPTITVPIGAANLHNVLNWLIGQINNQAAGSPNAPQAYNMPIMMTAPDPPAAATLPAHEATTEGAQRRRSTAT